MELRDGSRGLMLGQLLLVCRETFFGMVEFLELEGDDGGGLGVVVVVRWALGIIMD